MRTYIDKLEVERLNEIVERIKKFSFILAFDKENKEYVYTEGWFIKEGESFEFYPDDLRLIVE